MANRQIKSQEVSEALNYDAGSSAEIYRFWICGCDMRELLLTRAFRLHRMALLPYGVDIDIILPQKYPIAQPSLKFISWLLKEKA